MEQKFIRFLSLIGARGVLGQAVLDMADEGEEFYTISADLEKASGFERIGSKYPEKCINAGIAEQAMIGIAAGLSTSQCPVYATSWAVFASMRITDQIRNYLGGMKKNVKLIGLDSGLTKTEFGISHSNPQDIAIFRSQPNIRIVAPSDGQMLYKALKLIRNDDIPTYVRMTGGTILPVIYKEDMPLEIGKAIFVKRGKDVAFVVTGVILNEVIKTVKKMEKCNISCTIIDMCTIKPLDTEALDEVKNHKLIVSVEEHSVYGGLGSAISEYYIQSQKPPKMIILGTKDEMLGVSSYEEALKYNELDENSIFQKVLEKMNEV